MNIPVSPYVVTIYVVFNNYRIVESGVGAIFMNCPGKIFPLSIPEDPRPLLNSSWLLASHGSYRVRVLGSYESPMEIGSGTSPVLIRAVQHLGELIDNGIANEKGDEPDE